MLKTPGGCGEQGGEEPGFERRLTSHEAHLLLQVDVLPGSTQKELPSFSLMEIESTLVKGHSEATLPSGTWTWHPCDSQVWPDSVLRAVSAVNVMLR